MPSRRQLLADELIRIRRRAGLSGRAMAEVLGVKQAQLYRYDHGVTPIRVPKVRAWLDACRAADPESVDADTRARLLVLAEEVFAEPRSWRAMRNAGNTNPAAEPDADIVEEWAAQSVVLPGLLQTPEYAVAAVVQADLHGQLDHDAQVAARLTRQARLFEPGTTWRFLIAERLLTWSPGSDALLPPQRDRLASLAESDGIELAVLADSARMEPSGLWWSPFTLVAPHGADRFVAVEDVAGERSITAADEVASYLLLWERLWSAAVKGVEAVRVIRAAG